MLLIMRDRSPKCQPVGTDKAELVPVATVNFTRNRLCPKLAINRICDRGQKGTFNSILARRGYVSTRSRYGARHIDVRIWIDAHVEVANTQTQTNFVIYRQIVFLKSLEPKQR